MTVWPFLRREQERIRKAEQARLETERILQEKQAAVDAKKAEMQKREAEKEKVRRWSCIACQQATRWLPARFVQ